MTAALIDPILDFGDAVAYGWGAYITQDQVRHDPVADNDKMRYITGPKRDDHVTEYRKRMNGLIPERAKLHSAVLIFKQLPNRSPGYLNYIFVRSGDSLRYL